MRDDAADGDDVHARGDFLRWAMGSSSRAAAVILLPVLAGLILGIVAMLVGFGLRYPTLMYGLIPYDITSNYECFVLPRNVIRGCLLLAPVGAAVAFWIQPRFRLAGDGDQQAARIDGPGIDPAYWLITALGVLLVAVVPAMFDLFGGGWYLACRIQEIYGIGGRIALTAMIVLLAPATCVAAITIAYHFRKRIALAAVPQAARKALRPIGLTLIAAGLICVVYAGWIVRKSDPGTALFTGALYLAAGTLIFHGSLGAARLMGWWSAAEITIAIGLAFSAPWSTPLGLFQARLRAETMDTVFPIAVFFLSFVLMLWIFLAVRDKTILGARKAAGRSTALPWTALAFGVLAIGSQVVGMATARSGELTAEAERRARAKYGTQYSYYVTSVGVSEDGDRVFANVTGYGKDKVFDADVDWKR